MGFELVATRGTTRYINDLGLRCDPISKVMQGSPLVVNLMREGRGAMVNNTTEADTNKDSFLSGARHWNCACHSTPHSRPGSGHRNRRAARRPHQ
jgi:hypothetical protein